MSSSLADSGPALVVNVAVTEDALTVELVDGRSLSVPLEWYPRLVRATPAERNNWRLIGRGEGVHWPELDEDVSASGLLAGRASAEAQASLERWMLSRERA
jgi:uncharacterized protein DUF2442